MNRFYKNRLLTLETFDKRAVNFYKNKLKFEELGKKIRFFKIFTVFKNGNPVELKRSTLENK
jgi:hypothetical protein